jgi:hypothetical protein
VRDERNQPVFGAALLVDREQVFTDSEGVFVSRKKKDGEYDLSVDLANFLFPGEFVVVSAPARVRTTRADMDQTPILVRIRTPRNGILNASSR